MHSYVHMLFAVHHVQDDGSVCIEAPRSEKREQRSILDGDLHNSTLIHSGVNTSLSFGFKKIRTRLLLSIFRFFSPSEICLGFKKRRSLSLEGYFYSLSSELSSRALQRANLRTP